VKLLAVLGLILLNGLLQLVGVTSVFPFFALASDPDRIRNSNFGRMFLQHLPPMSSNHLLVVAGCFAIVMLVLASAGGLYSEVLRIRYAWGFCHWLRRRLLISYAAQPYSYFMHNNSAVLYQKLWDVQTFVQNLLLPLGEILTRLILILFLAAGIFVVQPWIALGAVFLLGGCYLLIFRWVRPRAGKISNAMQFHQVGLGKNANQLLHGIKTVMIHGRSDHFIQRAMDHSSRIGEVQSRIPLYGNGPRYMIEPIAFGGLVAIVVVMASQGRPFSDILPNLAVMAVASMRLLPALQLLFSQLVIVSANNYTLTQLEVEIGQLEDESCGPKVRPVVVKPLAFDHEIRLENITFGYSSDSSPILMNFNLMISKNQSVGIAGPSGSGKSTLVDLLLGLHSPQSGRILIDDQKLTLESIGSWRQMIGYVPQDIYLLDETIAENIAFGIHRDQIDEEALRHAAEGAQILDFIEKELPEGFRTVVGERGVRLSGGQRQRIGLARALYHRPQVLILDEATSALDHATEAAVMDTIHKLQGNLTIITIAHRLSTLERCDKTIVIKKNYD
jgi:ATP-binding cassette subfamily C protein